MARRKRAINDPLVRSEYRRMRGKTGGVVGEDARRSLDLARARAEFMRRDDVEIEHQPEQESYESVYGEAPPEGVDYIAVLVKIKGRVAASLGFVEDIGTPQGREYIRQIENELLAEAFAEEKGGRRNNPAPSVTKSFPSGAWKVSDIINGRLVTRSYMGYTKRQAIAAFRVQTRPPRKSNPAPRTTAALSTGDAVAAHELFLFIINDSQLYNSQAQAIIVNLQRKIKRGIYRPDLALKLWRYLADSGAKKYTYHTDPVKRFGGSWHQVKGYGIFTVPIREATARELAAHYDEAVHSKIDPRGAHINPIKGPGKFEGELYVTRYAHENYDDEIGDVQEIGWYGRFSGKIKGRGPFYIIVREDNQGFVSGKLYDSERKLNRDWAEIVKEYEKLYEERGDE